MEDSELVEVDGSLMEVTPDFGQSHDELVLDTTWWLAAQLSISCLALIANVVFLVTVIYNRYTLTNWVKAGKSEGGSISTADLLVLAWEGLGCFEIEKKIVSCNDAADSYPVRMRRSTVLILPPLGFPGQRHEP